MRISARQLVFFALVVIFYTGFSGAQYYLNNRFQEVGILFAVLIFLYGAVVSSLNSKQRDLAWNSWVFGTLLFVSYTVILPGILWGNHHGVNSLASIAASREFLIAISAASIYLICRAGFDIRDVERSFYLSLIIICVSYLFFRYTFNLEAMLNSPNPAVSSLVNDGHRGLRLKPPTKALICLLIIAPLKALYTKEQSKKKYWWIAFILAAWAIWIQQGRTMMAGILFGVLCYNLFWSRKNRLHIFYFALPVIVTGLLSVNGLLYKELSKATDGDNIRWESIQTAMSVVEKYPLFGIGKSSNATISDTQLFGKHFFPADIGLFGVAYKFGLIGLAFYLIMLAFLTHRAISFNLIYKAVYREPHPIMVACTVNLLNDILFCIVTANLTFIFGLTIASIIIGVSAVHLKQFKRQNLI